MTSLLRQIVAGPRAKHAETGLDLCYVTDDIIVTSGPSQAYPQRAYRNPLDRLVTFLDAKHGDQWAIWEFRAEGTGYPDEAVYGRVRHYPWPDHHPPPFRLVPMIMASMRNWLEGEEELTEGKSGETGTLAAAGHKLSKKDSKDKRVVVVHCKAGKGRSGTMTCSYLISQCGWKAEDALARFTERRMRPKFGAGVSIPSQLRWVSYVDRWTKGGKKYVDREVEILEIHVWGLRHGVKIDLEGFADEGKKIKVFHTFKKDERCVVQGDAPGGGGMMDFLGDALSPPVEDDEIYEDANYNEVVDGSDKQGSDSGSSGSGTSTPARSKSKKGSRVSVLSGKPSRDSSVKKLNTGPKTKTINPEDYSSTSSASSTTNVSASNTSTSQPATSAPTNSTTMADSSEPGGMAVILKPSAPIRLPNSDVCIRLERRNRAPSSMGFAMVTAVAHVWFNVFFEGRGPEQDGKADDSGVFEIPWDKMDGLKGSSRKGTRAAERISVVWRTVGTPGPVSVVNEPAEGSPVPQMRPADWKGVTDDDPEAVQRLGVRAEGACSECVSKASSIKSQEMDTGEAGGDGVAGHGSSDDESLKGVKSSDPMGEELRDNDKTGHEKKLESGGSTSPVERLQQAAAAPVQEARASETAIKQQQAEEEAEKTGESDTDKEAEGSHSGGKHKLGFVKKGKKLLPTHHKKTDEDGKDSRLVSASVKK